MFTFDYRMLALPHENSSRVSLQAEQVNPSAVEFD